MIRKPGFKVLLIIFGIALFFLVAAFFLQWLFSGNPDLSESYAAKILPILTGTGIVLWGWIPTSLTEILVIAGAVTLVVLFIRWLVRLIHYREWRGLRSLRLVVIIVTGLSFFAANYFLLYAINFLRPSLVQNLELEIRPRSQEELAEVTNWLAAEAAILRQDLPEDENGVFTLGEGGYQYALRVAYLAYENSFAEYPILSHGLRVTPKPVRLSTYWSYTGITGMYMPLLAEANVNIDQPDISIPFAALHEIAHVKGIAPEDEANFIAFLTALNHPDPAFRYSALFTAWIYASNKLSARERDRACVRLEPSPAMRRDLIAHSLYWDRYSGKLQEISTAVNDSMLKANKQEDGVQSYGRMVDLIMAWYAKEQPAQR